MGIAGVLAMQPQLIILDEPTSMLDPSGRESVMQTLDELHESGITLIHITHSMDEALKAQRMIVMDAGRIVLDSTPEEIFTNHADELVSWGLELPMLMETAYECRQRGLDVGAGLSIVIENLCHVYGKGTPFLVEALKDVSLEIEKGQLTGIIGHTGSGKSTLAQHLNGLEQAQSGRVVVDSVELSGKYDKKAIRTKVGMVFQYPEQQLFEETVVKDICFGPKNLGLSEEQQIERAKSAMALMQIEYETFAERSPFDLSGGQKRRVAIAGVLAMEPDYLVLDEPTAGLDPEARRNLLTIIRRLPEQTGMGVLMVSHSMEDMAMYADKLAVMHQGKLVRFGTPEEIFSHEEELRQAGLAVPTLSRLTKALQKALEGRQNHGDE